MISVIFQIFSEEHEKNAVLPQGSYIIQNFTAQTDTAQILNLYVISTIRIN